MRRATTISLALLLLLFAAAAQAQEFDVVSDPNLSLDPLTETNERELGFYSGFTLLPDSNIVGRDGSVSVTRLNLGAQYSIFTLDYAYSSFDWSSDASLDDKTDKHAPWNGLHDLSLQARLLKGSFMERWHYWLNGEITSAFEEGFPGAVGAGFNGELAFDFWEGWMIGGLMRVTAMNPLNSDLFADGELGLAIHVSQKHVRQALEAIGVDTKTDSGREYSFHFAYSAQDKTYRLSPGSGYVKNGYVGIRRSKIGAYLDLKLSENFTMSLGPEYHFNREYKTYNSSGSRLSTTAVSDSGAGYIGLSWTY